MNHNKDFSTMEVDFGDASSSFVDDYDDDEFLLNKALARDGLYRGMSSVILSLIALSKLI